MRLWFRPSKKDMRETINFLYIELDHEIARTNRFKKRCVELTKEVVRLEHELDRNVIVKHVEKEY